MTRMLEPWGLIDDRRQQDMSAVTQLDPWLPLDELLRNFRPGSNPPPWSWEDEENMLLSACCLCCGEAGHYQRQLEAHIAEHGLDQGVCLGDDGRVWDGHHRITAARRLGIERIPLESPEDAQARWARDHPQPVPLVNGYTDRPVESWKQWNPQLVSGAEEARKLWGGPGHGAREQDR